MDIMGGVLILIGGLCVGYSIGYYKGVNDGVKDAEGFFRSLVQDYITDVQIAKLNNKD